MFKKENLRKNFLRVKQNIDQNLGRAEQSTVLTEDEQENEKRVETVRHVFQNIVKKTGAALQAPGLDSDKKIKKLPETGLSMTLIESAQALGRETLLGSVCSLCGDSQNDLAHARAKFEESVEQEVMGPLQNIADVEIPNIVKLRKALNKSILDMDSAKTRLRQTMRQSHAPGANMTNVAAKVDVIKEEVEEATQKVETIKDNLSIELCSFIAKECDQSSRLLKFLEDQAVFHRRALEIIEEYIPKVAVTIKNSPTKPCYGMPLEEHLCLVSRDIAVVLEACASTLVLLGLEEEGLFRLAPSSIKLKKLKACFDAHVVDMDEFVSDPHTIAGALKQYLRELPEPLLTYELYDDFIQAAMLPQDQSLQALWTVVNRLPQANYNNLRYLIKFLSKLAEKSEINKMKPSNIGIVMGPNLIWSQRDNLSNMMVAGAVSGITEVFVTHADWFFPGDIDFGGDELGPDIALDQLEKQPENLEPVQVQVPHDVNQTVPTVVVVSSAQSSSGSLLAPSESNMDTGSATLRRLSRKPAPPPPQDRPHAAAPQTTVHENISSSNTTAHHSSDSQPPPVVHPTTHPPPDQNPPPAKPKPGPPTADRPSMPPPQRPDQAPPERPRPPPSLKPPPPVRGHQRSASTGALAQKSSGMLDGGSTTTGLSNAGSLSSGLSEGSQDGADGSCSIKPPTENHPGAHQALSLGYNCSSSKRPLHLPPLPSPVAEEFEFTKL